MEPGRDFPGVDLIREIAERSLEKALVAGFDSTISFLLFQRQTDLSTYDFDSAMI